MMYDSKLSACIKVNNKVLREFKDTAYIPFGSEYQLSLKNLHVKRAIAHITIDGTDVIPGGLVINPGQTIDLERFVKDGNLSSGNRFKFIERTASVEQHRGIGAEDGLIRIEFQYEIDYPKYEPPKVWGSPWYPDGRRDVFGSPQWTDAVGGWHSNVGTASDGYFGPTASLNTVQTKGITRSLGASGGVQVCATSATSSSSISCNASIAPQGFMNDVGITVPGSVSDQKFSSCYGFPLESEKHVIILKLMGETPENTPVQQPVTVKTKPKCVTCGRTNKANAKFCTNCGTALHIV